MTPVCLFAAYELLRFGQGKEVYRFLLILLISFNFHIAFDRVCLQVWAHAWQGTPV